MPKAKPPTLDQLKAVIAFLDERKQLAAGDDDDEIEACEVVSAWLTEKVRKKARK